MIYKGRSYFTPNASLVMTILKIQYQNDQYVKFKGILSNKTNNIIYETKNYKINKDILKHWIELKGV